MCRSSCLQYHLCLPFACFFPWSWNAYKREKCQTSRLKPYRKYRKNRKSAFLLVGCWLLAAGCYCRWLLLPLAAGYWLYAGLVAYNITFVDLLRAFSHVLETLIKRKKCQTSRLKPYIVFFCRLLATGCWLLLALAAHLCLPFACFFPWSRNPYKRQKCQTSRLKPYRKYWKYSFFW